MGFWGEWGGVGGLGFDLVIGDVRLRRILNGYKRNVWRRE